MGNILHPLPSNMGGVTPTEREDKMNTYKNQPNRPGQPIIIEEPWASAFQDAGMVAPNTGAPSIQALHRETGLHPSAISRIIKGETEDPRPETVEKMANGLGVSPVKVAHWIGMKWEEFSPWTPPTEADLMTIGQREIVNRLIRELTKTVRES